jgi:hypothetical protein
MKSLVILSTVITLVLSSVMVSAQPLISDFEIVSFWGEWRYGTLYAIGEIRNYGSYSGGPKVEVISRDVSGNLVDSDKFWQNSTDNILPGESCGITYPLTRDQRAQKVEIKVISVTVWRNR